MKKLLVTMLVLMITMLALVACSRGGNVEDESSDGAMSMISSVMDEFTSDDSKSDSSNTSSSQVSSDASSQTSSN